MTAASTPIARISLVDLSGESTVRYTPLAVMYLRAALESDPDLSDRVEVTIHSFLAGTSLASMADGIAAANADLIGLSCQGWNIAVYRQLLPTLRQLLPETVIVLGGNHVSHQGHRWLAQAAEADVVVNGEGEHTIRELTLWLLDSVPALGDIKGITYRHRGEPTTTAPRPRVSSLDDLPSPYLSMSGRLADFDVALWETNRGCPYHCSFCYWGGAVGQKLSQAEVTRLRGELDMIAAAGVPAIFLCDANFGILPRDTEIAGMVTEARQRYGTPNTLHVNWAKNHAHRVGEILDVLRDGDVRSNVYLALQTLSRPALALAGRDERGRPEMMQLARRILSQGGDVGAELIFGLPGETLKDFRAAYDELFLQFPSLLLHPLWVLPNTTYDSERSAIGLITLRPDPTVDYEGVLQHNTLSRQDNQAGLRLLLADEILVGTGYARTTVRGLARWARVAPTQILDDFTAFVSNRSDDLSVQLSDAFAHLDAECYFHRHLRSAVRRALFSDRNRAWRLLDEFVTAQASEQVVRAACRELARYDTALLPRTDADGSGYVEETITLNFDVHAAARALLSESPADSPPAPAPSSHRIQHRAGFNRHSADAIDFAGQWQGRTIEVSPATLV
jgi:radical SAM superfamily enzyme YgiQ (UPF0313 family)